VAVGNERSQAQFLGQGEGLAIVRLRGIGLEPVGVGRVAIETAVHEELRPALAATPYECNGVRRGYRSGTKARTLTAPTGQSYSPGHAPHCTVLCPQTAQS
jgi:hypothetical protein